MEIALVLWLTLTLCLGTGQCSKSRNCSPELLDTNPFPYLVGLHAAGHWCGGSLISETFILTAAHCVAWTRLEKITTYLGCIYFRRGLRRTPLCKIVHPEFDVGTLLNDIAILRIPSVKLSENIKTVALPSIADSYDTYEVDVAIASGWGLTNNGRHSQVTLSVELLVISNEGCTKYYNRPIPESQLCAATPSGSGICLGDSGGSFVLKETGVLIGITSYSPTNSCVPHFGSAFTRVTSYRKWIANHTGL